jgi:hypothetical protein
MLYRVCGIITEVTLTQFFQHNPNQDMYVKKFIQKICKFKVICGQRDIFKNII